MAARLLGGVVLALALAAQVDAAGTAVVENTCPSNVDFEREGYTIRKAIVLSPFSFLTWMGAPLGAANQNVTVLQGKPFNNKEIDDAKAQLDRLNFDESVEDRVAILLSVVSVTNCSDQQLDLVFTVLSSQIAPVLSGTFESRRLEQIAPERVAGTDAISRPFRLEPTIGYDRADRFYGGGRFEYKPARSSGAGLVNSIVAQGWGSAEGHQLSASLAGARDSPDDAVAHVDWQLDYLNSSQPTVDAQLRRDRLAGRWSMMTRPLGSWEMPIRLGGLIEGGKQNSDFRGSDLPPGAVNTADYGSTKLFIGTSTRLDNNVLAASYGIELGSIGPATRLDWIKHVGDFAHELSLPLGDHRALTIESRLTAGYLQVKRSVPAATLFFGGNREEPFVPGDAWVIRANPFIRSIGANLYARTSEGLGATRFVAYNLTAAYPVWRTPLVPSELSKSREVRSQLDAGIASATTVLEVEYRGEDTHFKRVVSKLPDLQASLSALNSEVVAAQAAHPGDFGDLFKSCLQKIATAERRVRNASAAKAPSEQYGDVVDLLGVDGQSSSDDSSNEGPLKEVQKICVDGLSTKIPAPAVAKAGSAVDSVRAEMQRELALIDENLAKRKANSDMIYVKRTIDTMLDQVNVASISPVFMFDVAHIGPADARVGTRYGVGGGLRATLVNSVDFTIGYSANPRHQGKEASGAFFMSLQFKDFLQ